MFLVAVAIIENVSGALSQGFLPLVNLTWMNIESTGKLGYRLLALDCLQGYLGLEGRVVFPAVLFHVLLPFRFIILGAKLSLNQLSEFWGPAQNMVG